MIQEHVIIKKASNGYIVYVRKWGNSVLKEPYDANGPFVFETFDKVLKFLDNGHFSGVMKENK